MKNHGRSIILYGAIVVLLAITVRLGGGGSGMTLNYVFLLAMGILILFADICGISRVSSMTADLRNIISKILGGKNYDEFMSKMSAMKEKPDGRTRAYNEAYLDLMGGLNFGRQTANEDWHRFLKDWKAADGLNCDVEDYLGEDEILECCNYNICTQIPGVLTALGILGTFLGLVLGLRSFDFSNADQMTSSVEALVSGLNVAFYTSIYGVTLSILYNLVFRRTVTDLSTNLNRFYDVFHAALKPASQKDMAERFCGYEEQQNELLLAIQQLMEQRFGERLAGQMAETLTPVFERINQSLDHIILDFHKEQAASLEKIVDAFVVQMSGSLNSHIHVLGDSVDQLSQAQNVMSEELKQLIGQIARTGADTAQINEQAGAILEQLNGYVAQLEKTTSDSAEIIRQMSGWSENIEHMSAAQSEILKTLTVHEKNLDETCVKINENQTVLTERLETFTKAAGMIAAREQDPMQFNEIKDMLSAYMTAMQQLQNENIYNVEKQHEKRAKAISDQMAELLKMQQDIVYLNGRIAGILSGSAKEGRLELPSGGSNGNMQTSMEQWMEAQSRKMDDWIRKQEIYQKRMLELEAERNRSVFRKIRDFFGGRAE